MLADTPRLRIRKRSAPGRLLADPGRFLVGSWSVPGRLLVGSRLILSTISPVTTSIGWDIRRP